MREKLEKLCEGIAPDKPPYKQQNGLADVFGMSPRTIAAWMSKPGEMTPKNRVLVNLAHYVLKRCPHRFKEIVDTGE